MQIGFYNVTKWLNVPQVSNANDAAKNALIYYVFTQNAFVIRLHDATKLPQQQQQQH